MLKVVKEVNDECAPIATSILADPDASSKQGVVSLLKARQEAFRKRLKVPSTNKLDHSPTLDNGQDLHFLRTSLSGGE
jgi:hypothetical protein